MENVILKNFLDNFKQFIVDEVKKRWVLQVPIVATLKERVKY